MSSFLARIRHGHQMQSGVSTLHCTGQGMQPSCGRNVLQSTWCRSASVEEGRPRARAIKGEEDKLRTLVHGDDFATVGSLEGVRWLQKELESAFETKTDMAGHSRKPGVATEAKILNRVIRAVPTRWDYNCDQRHAEIIPEELDFKDCKPVGTPEVEETLKRSAEDEAHGATPLSPAMATQYRGLTARANYMAQDRAEIQYAVKELCRTMSAPNNDSWSKLKRLAKYLARRPRAVSLFSWQRATDVVDVYSDANWAGCKTVARARQEGLLWGSSVLKSYSKTQGLLLEARPSPSS